MKIRQIIAEDEYDYLRDTHGKEAARRMARSYDKMASRPKPGMPQLKSMVFFNVPPEQEQVAKELGLKQSKSGKWYVGVYDKSGRNTQFKIKLATDKFGPGKSWSPK